MAGSWSSDNQKFCMREVLDTFKLCLSPDKEVYLEHYVAGWRGLVKFLNSLGSVFTFISKDAVSKIQILSNFLSGESSSQYVTVQSMVSYELENQLVDVNKTGIHPESGCRTLLRLHRALRWLELFLERLRTSDKHSKTSVMCSEAYNESLAQHHPWLVRKAAGLAFVVLPGRTAFFEVMNVGPPEQVVAVLGEALPLILEVYQITEDLYAKHHLLDLP
ncbi:ceramide-1-phosphate transfer protein [Nothobranchius furzeri]|uniref:Ceramide-1-phosphate transfer protein n=3 Tax=Nothobranchius TaxID=28779 RepID=A0A1A7ZZP4_NOTFU|nr:ceramide-1-phosphate transfer protein [Nothobranchius furzeri]KAF7209196.1 ceramide-1-phosphate transfer protein [Nothobranchius furzeri]